MKELLREHLRRYPLARPQDMVKLLYQAEFGGGHMGIDREYGKKRLMEELAGVRQREECRMESVGGGLMRFPLSGLKASGLSEETLAALFIDACAPRGSREGFEAKLNVLRELAESGETPFSQQELNEYLAKYEKAGMPAARHSEEYRGAYRPAYRLVSEMAERYLPVLAAMDGLLREKSGILVKIDGDCASGKSTLGACLQRIYGAQLFHMDDYFLPPERKTAERLAEPGGNVDRERFWDEVDSKPLNRAVSFRKYSCESWSLGDWQTVPAAPVRVVEGSYCLHPELKKPDLSVFLRIDGERQRERILKRNGPEKYKRFVGEWIPMEKRYDQALGIAEKCDVALDV